MDIKSARSWVPISGNATGSEGSQRGGFVEAMSDLRAIGPPFALLLIALLASKTASALSPALWILVPITLAAVLSRARFSDAEIPIIRLWQLIGLYSAVYSVLHYPLLPLARDDTFHSGLYVLLLICWAASLAAGILCFRIPSLSLLPVSFLGWSNAMAGIISGFPPTTHLDVQPLPEIAVCIGFGLLINRAYPRFSRSYASAGPEAAKRRVDADDTTARFARLLLLIAISIHLANYFWSFSAKMRLRGPFGAWLAENNPAYIFLAALDDNHILISGYPAAVRWVYMLLDEFHVFANSLILFIQAATIIILLLPKRALIVLLLMLDVMHFSIILIAGANFWPWIILNIIITAAVINGNFRFPPLSLRLVATGFILIAPLFVAVARLGWFDTGANNKIFLEAVDESGRHHAVPSNFFTFYSYSFGHMDYGTPNPVTAFATQEPNGGAADIALFRAGRSCDVKALVRPGGAKELDGARVAAFVRNYHRLALHIEATLGGFPYDYYPHHFAVPRSASEDFLNLDKRRIVAYMYKRESVCLSFDAGGLERKLISSADYRIDLGAGDGHGDVGLSQQDGNRL
jgi:hypothetical protein